ncbi:MAG: FGGY family carbohydrate kinase, partial [Pseudomonadota bacterium]|nr:FGGY family carbohydrate kinase [Pseudomonadota bacterium]
MDEIYAIGLDYGTESARAILVDVRSGQIIAKSTEVYPDGVISEKLPQSDIVLPNNWALQNPNDWLFVATKLVKEIVSSQLIKPEQVIGLGIDFTSCTLLPVLADGTPLCWLDGLRSEPHAWPKLWKHHSPQNQADRITQLAQK